MNILLTGSFSYTDKQIKEIEELGYNVTFQQDETVELDFDFEKFDVVVCNSLFLYNDIKKFTNLKAVQLLSSGIERFPIKDVDLEKIKLLNARGIYSIPIAEWIILKILELYKDTPTFINNQSNKIWEKKRDLLELYSNKACIVGAGSIGTEVAKRLKGFGVEIIGIASSIKSRKYFDRMYTIDKLYEGVKDCDLIILTIPLTDETKGLIDKNLISYMKKEAIIINVSRGGVINEYDLINALNNNDIGGAILDVFEQEPLSTKNALWEFKNVIITPHNSFVSNRNRDRLYKLIINNLEAILKNEKLTNRVV